MKKLICVFLALLVSLSCLSACSFTRNMSGSFAGEAEATPKVEEMMVALAEANADDAIALMHPQIGEAADNALAQISAYLSGRKVRAMEQTSISVNTSTGTSGKVRQERVAYQVKLTDGAVVYLNVVYLSNNQGEGFASFQLVLGVV